MSNRDTGAASTPDEVTVVIPVKNGAADIGQQLEALARQDYTGDIHLIVSDNGSTDDLPGAVAPFNVSLATCRIIYAGQRPGVAHARNRGLQEATTDKILFCDADDEVESTWARALAAGLDHGGIAGGPMAMGQIDEPEIARDFQDITTPPSIHGYLPYAVGANLGVRRDLAMEIGGFDRSYGAGHEEVDFAWRIQRTGGEFVWCPEAIVHYRQRVSSKAAYRQRLNYSRSAILLWTRFQDTAALTPVSFQGSVRHLVANLLRAPKLLNTSTRRSQAMALGWTAGTVAGHLKYRFRPAPPRELMDTDPT